MRFFKSEVLGVASNTRYPDEYVVTQNISINRLKEVFNKDYVCASYTNNKRARENFIISDCLAFDCDNDYSENPKSWITVNDIIEEFKDVFMVFHMSRNHMKEKNGKAARPKFHVFMAMDEIKDEEAYAELKRKVNSLFPYFDKNAEDSARFFFGTEHPEVVISPGSKTINQHLDIYEKLANMGEEDEIIHVGERNSKLSKFAAIILKRYGDTEEAYQLFMDKNEKCCEVPLEEEELEAIWKSAQTFYKNKILTNPNYVPPEEFVNESFIPSDLSDVGQAKEFVKHYGDIIAYNPAMRFLVYRNNRWVESEEYALEVVHRFTDKQIMQALKMLKEAEKSGDKKRVDNAKGYLKFVTSRRNSNFINATLKQATPYITKGTEEFDKDPFILATLDGVYDLR